MAFTTLVTNKGALTIGNGSKVWTSDTFKVMLLQSFTNDKDDHYVSAISVNEASCSGYTGGFGGAGRKSLTSKTITEDDTNDRVAYDAADVTWTALGAGNTLVGVGVIVEITDDTASPIIAYLAFSSSFVTNGGDLTVQFDANGLILLST